MSLRVLVVEDDREIRSMMQSSLAVEGFEVQTATGEGRKTGDTSCRPDRIMAAPTLERCGIRSWPAISIRHRT